MPQCKTTCLIVGAMAISVASSINAAPAADSDATPPTGDPKIEYVPDELIIGFDDVPTEASLDALRTQFPAIIRMREINHAPHPKNDPTGVHPLAMVRVANLSPGSDVPGLSDSLSAMPGIDYAHPNYIMRPALVPNDPFWNSQYGPQIVQAPTAWDTTTGSASIVVAVADTGINFQHQDFQNGMIWTNPGEIPGNGIDDDNNGYIDDVNGWDCLNDDNYPYDTAGHGSHVAGILGARLNNGLGIAGMAQVTVMPLQVFNPGGTWEAITEAIYYATDNGAKALNYSGGGYGGTGSLSNACQYAWSNGTTVVAAAGNNNSSSPFYPAAYTPVLAISGTDSNDNRYGSSNYGNWIDVAAPGVNVFSCWSGGSSSYNYATGTSMSSPHACGLVGLMYSVNPNLTPQEVRNLLRDNADDLGAAGFDIYFGYGRINAANTIAAISTPCPGDANEDDLVDIDDVFAVLGAWGPCNDCPEDVNDDGVVDIDDIFDVLANWGPCE
ncbi:MAG: S8 family serine peptidase [Phycisphaerales bacterium]|nr:MAG: S8 family serine peptidase [Phycisphaerales bacterium]